ncbi:hypothetical protein T11_9931 [Trichinella zimbabwensis]|uniref:Uncharacterized protein n=1 Tax=Trichinella zimbabwensis TaxID=268475 RepID=A0A0V1HST7_9BILA|nr:hypothetical protein T11_9931 [Trichinella zimbabwensis]
MNYAYHSRLSVKIGNCRMSHGISGFSSSQLKAELEVTCLLTTESRKVYASTSRTMGETDAVMRSTSCATPPLVPAMQAEII